MIFHECAHCERGFSHKGSLANHERRCGGPGTKWCNGCEKVLPLQEFWRGKTRRNLRSKCRSCVTARNWENKLSREYGLTLPEWEEMAALGCAICGTMVDLVVDHDHSQGAPNARGVLCRQHNSGLGQFGDSPGLLRQAADYLEARA